MFSNLRAKVLTARIDLVSCVTKRSALGACYCSRVLEKAQVLCDFRLSRSVIVVDEITARERFPPPLISLVFLEGVHFPLPLMLDLALLLAIASWCGKYIPPSPLT